MLYDVILSKTIISTIREMGITETELSEKVHYNIDDFLNNRKNWPYFIVVLISDVLGVSLDKLSGRL